MNMTKTLTRTPTILLVEDSVDDAALTRRAILSSAPDTTIALLNDGQRTLEYLDQACREGAQPNLIFLDLKLPGMCGIEVLKAIRSSELMARIPVVILSSIDRGSAISECFDAGASCYLVKPMDFDDYIEAIGRATRHWLADSGASETCPPILIKR